MSIQAHSGGRSIKALPFRVTHRRLAVWGSLGLICIAAVSALLLLQGVDRQLRDISTTQSVRTAARDLTNALNQAEANQRGFLLTNDQQFLEPYQLAVSSIESRVASLRDMVANDVDQSRRIESVLGDMAGKLAEMARTVELVEGRRAEEAQDLTDTGLGARFMTEVIQTLEAFIAEEDQKLAQRSGAINQSRIGLVIALIAALLAAVILAYALLTRTQRQVSDLTVRQRGLVSQNEALELLVAERTRDIQEARTHAERERARVEALLQETNHRIGNSLATVSSLLALQMLRAPTDDVRQALEAARLRVHAIASAHRRLRLGEDMETASADEFLQAVLDDIIATQTERGRIAIVGEIEAIEVAARDATTVGILAAELVTNAIKYAFPDGRSGTITVRLLRDEAGGAVLSVSDDGVGLAAVNGTASGGLGAVIVKQLSSQFGGEPRYQNHDGGGLTVTIPLPKLGRSPAGPVET